MLSTARDVVAKVDIRDAAAARKAPFKSVRLIQQPTEEMRSEGALIHIEFSDQQSVEEFLHRLPEGAPFATAGGITPKGRRSNDVFKNPTASFADAFVGKYAPGNSLQTLQRDQRVYAAELDTSQVRHLWIDRETFEKKLEVGAIPSLTFRGLHPSTNIHPDRLSAKFDGYHPSFTPEDLRAAYLRLKNGVHTQTFRDSDGIPGIRYYLFINGGRPDGTLFGPQLEWATVEEPSRFDAPAKGLRVVPSSTILGNYRTAGIPLPADRSIREITFSSHRAPFSDSPSETIARSKGGDALTLIQKKGAGAFTAESVTFVKANSDVDKLRVIRNGEVAQLKISEIIDVVPGVPPAARHLSSEFAAEWLEAGSVVSFEGSRVRIRRFLDGNRAQLEDGRIVDVQSLSARAWADGEREFLNRSAEKETLVLRDVTHPRDSHQWITSHLTLAKNPHGSLEFTAQFQRPAHKGLYVTAKEHAAEFTENYSPRIQLTGWRGSFDDLLRALRAIEAKGEHWDIQFARSENGTWSARVPESKFLEKELHNLQDELEDAGVAGWRVEESPR